MTDRELFKMALDALDIFYDEYGWGEKQKKAHAALRARLAEDEITPDGWYRVDAWIKEKP